jgi:uncharacterized membrane protein YvlD (DUF360 family)
MGGIAVMQMLLKIVLKALAFLFLLPMIPGIHMHANFIMAACLAIFFSLMLWVVDIVAVAISTYLAITTFGAALLVLIPMWLLGFWLLPAVALKLVADFMPEFLSVAGWGPAILGGLLLFIVGVITSSFGSTRDSYRTAA